MKKGVKILRVNLIEGKLDLNELVIRLGTMSISSILIEGGGQVAASVLKAGIVNKVCYFIAPKIMGGSDGLPVFSGKGPEKIKDVCELSRVTTTTLGSDILVTGYIAENSIAKNRCQGERFCSPVS